MDVLIASRNKDKVKEIKDIISSLPLHLHTPEEFSNLSEVEEDKDTLIGNALKKGLVLSEETKLATIADDTGLFIDALSGEPGIYSARFAGENCSYADNRHKVLRLMKNVQNRRARFITVAVFCVPGYEPLSAEGIVEGEIIAEERGEKGFGYDPIFRVKNTSFTFAEMNETDKNRLSHRGIAFRNLAEKIADFLKSLNLE